MGLVVGNPNPIFAKNFDEPEVNMRLLHTLIRR